MLDLLHPSSQVCACCGNGYLVSEGKTYWCPYHGMTIIPPESCEDWRWKSYATKEKAFLACLKASRILETCQQQTEEIQKVRKILDETIGEVKQKQFYADQYHTVLYCLENNTLPENPAYLAEYELLKNQKYEDDMPDLDIMITPKQNKQEPPAEKERYDDDIPF